MDTLSAVPSNLNISEEVLRQEDAKILQQAIDRLPDMQKEVVILRFYHDRKLKEIAAITGVSLPTAKSRLKQGLDKLKRYLDKEDFKA
jgi:RNA polymerase sigma-70 factor (ECF subfamily)